MPEKNIMNTHAPGKRLLMKVLKIILVLNSPPPPPRKSQMVSLGVIFFGLPPFTILHLQLGTHV